MSAWELFLDTLNGPVEPLVPLIGDTTLITLITECEGSLPAHPTPLRFRYQP